MEVRIDPRVTVAPGEMDVWLREAQKIERTECGVSTATTRLRSLDAQLAALEASAAAPEIKRQAAAVRGELRPIGLTLAGPHPASLPSPLGGRLTNNPYATRLTAIATTPNAACISRVRPGG